MFMQIRLPLACLLIVVYCFCYYKLKKRLRTRTSKVFEVMTVATVIHLASAAVTEYTVNHRDAIPESINYIWHVIYLVSLSCACCLLLYYLLLYIERGTGKRKRTEKAALLLVFLVGTAAQIVLPIEYVDTFHGSYSLGMKAYSLYCVVAFVLVMMLVELVRYWPIIGREKSSVFSVSMATALFFAMVQMLHPYMLLSTLGLTMIELGLMVNIEDSHLYVSYNTGLYNELGLRETIQELLLGYGPFQVGVYVFLGNDGAVGKAMQSVKDKLPEKKMGLMCGTMSDNELIVLPLPKWPRAVQFPKEFPIPEEEDLKYMFDILSFTGNENVDWICNALRDCKSQFTENILYKDELTGLLRREAFIRKVARLIAEGIPFSLLMVDLDDFKSINDTFGHSVGDAVLEFTANTFRSVLRNSDVISRIGGDEFAIALYGVTDKKLIEGIVDRMMKTLAYSSVLPDEDHKISLSVGVKIHRPEDGSTSFEELYMEADSALYHAKYSGKNGMSFDDC